MTCFSKKGLSIFLFLPALLAVLPCFAAAAISSEKSPAINAVIQQVEMQRYSWYGLNADIRMEFTTPEGQSAGCQGELTYLRMHEKMLIECSDWKNEPVFVLKIDDMNFELFLPQQKQLYRGNIFDLENSKSFESHLKPFDLYRAIKPMPIAADHVRFESVTEGLFTFWVDDPHKRSAYPLRRMIANAKGDVYSEVFLSRDQNTDVAIYRQDFLETAAGGGRPAITFPHKILIENGLDKAQTEIFFQRVEFLWPPLESEWRLNYPPDTRVTNFTPMTPQARQEYLT